MKRSPIINDIIVCLTNKTENGFLMQFTVKLNLPLSGYHMKKYDGIIFQS